MDECQRYKRIMYDVFTDPCRMMHFNSTHRVNETRRYCIDAADVGLYTYIRLYSWGFP